MTETSPPAAKGKKVVKKAAPKKAADHPKYVDMILAAISALKERGGSSRQAILKYILANYKVNDKVATHLKIALKRGVAGGIIKQVKGIGASGSFKVADKAAKKPAVKKPAAKKPAAKKAAAKKPAAKKTATKPAAKKTPAKKTKTAKKTTTAPKKKPAAKKPASKKAKPAKKTKKGAKK